MYSTFSNIQESFKLAWKHKMLWILALVLMGGANFNSYSNLSNVANKSSDSIETPQLDKIPFDKMTPLEGKYNLESDGQGNFELKNDDALSPDVVIPSVPVNSVLGMAQASPNFNIAGFIGSLVIIAPIVLAVIFFWAAIGFLTSVWVKGALYSGLLKACNSEAYDFKDLGSEGKSNWKRYLKLALYFFFKRLLSVIPITVVSVVLAAVNGSTTASAGLNAVFGILMFLTILWALIYNIRLYFVEQFSLRSIIADNVPTKATFKLGWKYYKTRPGKSIKLALALLLVLPVFMLILFLPTGLLAGIVAFLVKQEASFLIIGLVGFFAAITGGVSMVVATPFICNVTNFSWTRLFLFARESFDTKPAQDPVEFMYKPEAANGQI
ncbi:MAG: hypothetical protein UV83_C0016G0004 [candidate division WWE3 bacterium GW2011_GWE2_43_18]|uniref:Uncharacterized protein n=3 Tax=Katanobacteria TaxID=422282 RepID=A0A1F4XDP2_UNCKA|nr:MAG: hypothetical protein UU59_C0010G0006 [candidate division WWE3 bacterium GW2011_GWE1_41_27]KKS60605.1 MAG: hypothetical protein UV26_C0003G0059 [candidate division WWE3 bacterium GW2011_GWF2_42_42]KKS63539.1 MAG: hypothetical protein UV31_C0008G0003 [candidate division WWE3 bacterium GW2011_GWF1_42_51]KKT04068.1 MAG: hypothetical protein UV83_C0016G0004 [candidate division WWE3 bacterium GW2011_GWE2_43_18]OGC79741.1 MAG: hypothetical protein A3K01_00535 [candidate division WWE3 bacterium